MTVQRLQDLAEELRVSAITIVKECAALNVPIFRYVVNGERIFIHIYIDGALFWRRLREREERRREKGSHDVK